jgi:hypothetical protein
VITNVLRKKLPGFDAFFGAAFIKDIVRVAVHQNGLVLQYASDELRGDKKNISAAIEQNQDAEAYVLGPGFGGPRL